MFLVYNCNFAIRCYKVQFDVALDHMRTCYNSAIGILKSIFSLKIIR